MNQQIKVKNPEPLIRAVKDLPVDLLLIGNGEFHERLKQVVNILGLNGQVTFIKSVPHSQIHRYYQQADIFVNPMLCGGVAMGTMEAMACGLPVVHAQPLWEEEPEVLGNLGVIVEPTPEGFRSGIRQLINNPILAKELGNSARRRMKDIDGRLMEQKECDLYLDVIRDR